MYCRRMLPVLSLLAAILLVPALWAWGDEGMWLFGDPPRKVLKERYDFTPTDAWLNHLRQSAVRFPRRLGVVRFARRAGDDQPSRRAGACCKSSARKTAT